MKKRYSTRHIQMNDREKTLLAIQHPGVWYLNGSRMATESGDEHSRAKRKVVQGSGPKLPTR